MVHEITSEQGGVTTFVVQRCYLIARRDSRSMIFDLSIMTTHLHQHSTRDERRKAGQACRDKVSRINQGKFDPKTRKFDPVELMKAAHKGRMSELLPLKNARMAVSPFTFYRDRKSTRLNSQSLRHLVCR